jgi:hypothetical protein
MESTNGALAVVTVERSGGFAGIPRTWEVVLDDDRAVAAWLPAIEACPWRDEPVFAPAPDRFVYRISARFPHLRRAATVPEQHMTGAWRELLDRVLGAGRSGRAGPE